MSSKEELMLNRLLVLVQVICIPLYFIVFNIIWHDDIKKFFQNDILQRLPNWLIWFEINMAIPIFFSLPWILFSIIRASKIADSYSLMGRALGKVRIDQKLFYGINAAFTLIFLLLPFGSPIITIIGFFVLFKIATSKVGLSRKLFWFIPALILSMIPLLVAIAFYSNYTSLFNTIWEAWQNQIDTLWGIGICMAISITFGNFVTFLSDRNIRAKGREAINPYRLIFLFKFIVFGIMLFLFFNSDLSVLNAINLVAGIVAVSEWIFRRMSKLPSEGGGANMMVFAFIIINMITKWIHDFANISAITFRTTLIIISGFIFFLLFVVSYHYAEDEELTSRG